MQGRVLLCAIRLMLMPHILSLVDHLFFIDPATFSFCMTKPLTMSGWQSIYYPLAPSVWAGLVVLLLLLPPLFTLVRCVRSLQVVSLP